MRSFLWLLLLPIFLCAQQGQEPYKSAEEIEEELQQAEARFDRAKKMFNPWYAGPLVTPSATMMDVGSANIQPYLFVTANYAAFNEDRHSVSAANNLYQLKVIAPVQIGVTDSTDLVIGPSAQASWQNGHSGGGFGDLSLTYGFLIFRETLYIPKFKFTISETFPTGRYKNLTSSLLNGTGGGSYQTQFGFATGKVIWWSYPYPMNTRLFLGYTIETVADVKGYNTYGGGIRTKGRVRPGNTFTADFGYELSFNQRWVFALDVVYVAQNRTKFHGTKGTLPDGSTAVVGLGYNDNLSLAPALEYNFSDVLAVLGGVQFSVYGRNSSNFVTGQLSVEYEW